jgi:hypothetical protein
MWVKKLELMHQKVEDHQFANHRDAEKREGIDVEFGQPGKLCDLLVEEEIVVVDDILLLALNYHFCSHSHLERVFWFEKQKMISQRQLEHQH